MATPDGRKPIFAFGRSKDTTDAGGGIIGQTTFTLVSFGAWTTGDPVFVSESGDTEVEYLGTVQSVSDPDITTEFGLVAAKAAGMKIWTPTLSVEMPSPVEARPEITRDSGIEFRKGLDGITRPIRSRDASKSLIIGYEHCTTSIYDDLVAFMENTSGPNFGLTRFGFAAWDYQGEEAKVYTMQATHSVPAFNEILLTSSRFVMDMQIINNSYPA